LEHQLKRYSTCWPRKKFTASPHNGKRLVHSCCCVTYTNRSKIQISR